MKFRTAVRASCRTLLLAALFVPALALRPQPLFAQGNACGLVKAADAAALLGGSPTQKPSPQGKGCSWAGADGKHKLLVLTYKNVGVPPEMAYTGARKGAGGSGDPVADEAGIGDKAFSGQASFGAFFIVLKQGRMIQLQYWTGAHGTAKDVAALRPVVKKAVAAF